MNMLTGVPSRKATHGRDALALHGRQERLTHAVRVDVQLREQERAGPLRRHALEHRPQGPAGPHQLRPQVDDDRPFARSLDHDLLERGVGHLHHVFPGRCSCFEDPSLG